MGIYDDLSKLDDEQSTATQAPQPTVTVPEPAPSTPQPSTDAMTPRRREPKTGVTTAGATDTVDALLEGADVSAWREVLARTETHSSTYRLTEDERRVAEDLVRDLWRKDKIKTSMNELARLGLMVLAHDYRQRTKRSLIHRVKKS